MRLEAGLELSSTIGPDATTAIGEATVGPGTLLAVLETQLGLGGPAVSPAQRVASILEALGRSEGVWSSSYAVDPWGTALRMLRDRDALTLQGWIGQPVSPRLDALFEVTRAAANGMGDRFAAVHEALVRAADESRRRLELEAIDLVDPEATWPGAIRRVLAALRDAGVEVRHRPPSVSHGSQSCDLQQARAGAFTPTGDGSLQLVRAQGALEAAEDLAAWLAERADPATTLVVAPDATLDGALRRAGLPTVGAASGAGAVLQVLPLCLQHLWDPPDPQRVFELCMLPNGPIPARLGRSLASALRQWPAVGSDEWNTAIAEHDFGDAEDPNAAARRRTRVQELFTTVVSRTSDAVPVQAVLARVEVLAKWVRGRMHADAPHEREDVLTRGSDDPVPRRPAFRAAWSQLEALRSLLQAHDTPTITAARLGRFVDAATAQAGVDAAWSAQAGLRAVASPGAVIRPMQTIVWCNFSRGAAPPMHEPSLRRAEREALAQIGVPIPSAGERALWAAQRWRRPLLMATRQLLLVCPHAEAPGERLHPHPLWDEIVAAMPDPADSRVLVTTRPGVEGQTRAHRTTAKRLPLPSPVRGWDVPARVLAPREQESPSALGTLVGCSLQWTLRYAAKLRDDGSTWRLGVGARELGSLAHEIVARVLQAEPTDPEQAALLASTTFDDIGPRHVAELFMPGHDDARQDARLTISKAARALVAWMSTHDLAAELVEGDLVRAFGPIAVGGRVDLLAGTPRVVVDLKWGGRERRRQEVASGTAYQLATYAYAAADGGRALPEYAYFIVREQLMIGRRGGPFDSNTTVDGPTPAQAWQWFARACEARLDELARGNVVAPGVLDDGPKDATISGDRLVLPPGCDYCSYDRLCGRAFAEDEGNDA
jgi:ATP-dependent helicase/nuclease subunit B